MEKISNILKRGFDKMSFAEGTNSIFELKGISGFESFYNNYIYVWNQIYGGYYDKWHKSAYKTVDGLNRERRLLSLNTAKALCAEMAELTWNEKCIVEVYRKNAKTRKEDDVFNNFVEGVLLDNSFYTEMQNLVETCYAFGGGCVKVLFDGKIKLDYVPAHRFIPISFRGRNIYEGVFINHIERQGKKYTLLEWHFFENNVCTVKNELYESNYDGILGRKIPLDMLFPDIKEVTVIENLKYPLFVYIRPNLANNFEDGSPLGISVFANALDTLKTIDICFDSFSREFVLGKKRIIVPSSSVRTVLDPVSKRMVRYFDASDEVYQAMDFEDGDNAKIIDNSSVLRVEEHISAINALLSILAMQTGLTVGTLSLTASGSIKTATEIVAENAKTYKTIKSHENVLSESIFRLVDIIISVGRLYNLIETDEYECTVRFDDSIIENKDSEIEHCLKLVAAGLMSKYTALVDVLAYTPSKAKEEIERIEKESSEIL